MSFAQWLADYGYLAVFVGSLLEGETILLLAGFAAHQGHLSLTATLTIAFVGGFTGDQVFFWLGRVGGAPLLQRVPRSQGAARRVSALLQRHDALLIVGIRFMYGLRIVGPIVMGTCDVNPWRFVLFNLIGAAIWSPLVGGIGFVCGEGLERLLGGMAHFEAIGLAVLVALALIVALLRGVWSARDR